MPSALFRITQGKAALSLSLLSLQAFLSFLGCQAKRLTNKHIAFIIYGMHENDLLDPEDRVYFSVLLETYGALLTETQQDICDLYLNFDLSLSEIADTRGKTRQSVHAQLRKSLKLMQAYEAKLQLMTRRTQLEELFDELKIRLSAVLAPKDRDILENNLTKMKKLIGDAGKDKA